MDFQGYSDNEKTGQVFGIDGFVFSALGTRDLFVNDVGTTVRGLQFDPDGIRIDLPRPASTATLVAGSYTPEPLEIIALDTNGSTVDQVTITGDNSVHTVSLTAARIVSVVVKGGGFEGLLVEVCIDGAAEPSEEPTTPETPTTETSPTETPPLETQCVDFQGYSDNEKTGQVFEIDGFAFSALGTRDLFVNDVGTTVRGLQFDPDGIRIDLPRPASTATLVAGSYTPEPLEIIALDTNGSTVDQVTIPGDNSVHTVSLTGARIVSVVVKGGGFEGLLVEVCIDGAAEPSETSEQPTLTTCQHTFDSFPGGIPVNGDSANPTGAYQSLNGNEFSEWGFLVASTPVADCAVVKTSYYSTPNNYLMLLDGDPCSGANRIEVTFLEPVRQVALSFSGASIDYMMEVYNQAGELLGAPTQKAEFDQEGRLFTVSFRSDSANISRIRFGYTGPSVAVVAIREISTCDTGSYDALD